MKYVRLEMVDESRTKARELVEQLHDAASRASPRLRAMLEEAACLLDAYQAGLTLSTPHRTTGYVLVQEIDLISAAARVMDIVGAADAGRREREVV